MAATLRHREADGAFVGGVRMSILVTGATGTIGSQVVALLAEQGADVCAFVRNPEKASLSPGVQVAKGDLMNVDSVRAALGGTRTLFLLNAVSSDELTQALIALNLAREAGVERIVYFSVIHSDRYVNVPHFAGKYTAEGTIREMGLPATILRPAYFMENDAGLKDAIAGAGVYPMPIGSKGLAMVAARDIAEIAVLELLRRDRSANPVPQLSIDIVGPDVLTGTSVAAIWSEALGRKIVYAGDDTSAFERAVRAHAPDWMAYDMKVMADRFQTDGMLPEPADVERLVGMLGRPLRRYRDFAAETAERWRS
jgi:uncharacterized protein YbjT (DUF2867 family)